MQVGRRGRRLRARVLRRNDYNKVQIGFLDPSLLPGEAEARQPKSLAAEGQAQQPRMEQQRKQQPNRQSPVLKAHALAVGMALEPEVICTPIRLGRRFSHIRTNRQRGESRCAINPAHVVQFASET